MKSFESLKLTLDSSVEDALKIIDSGGMKIALVLDAENKLLGTLSDGDVRRGLLRGLKISDKVKEIVNIHPISCGVNDSKEKLLQIALEKKIYQIPIVDNSGKLIGVEEIDELLKPSVYSNTIVLMAGGLGTRLSPLTDDKPKSLLHVGDKPILETIIENFSRYGFKSFIISLNYKSYMIEEYFGAGERYGVEIEYIVEKKRMGTAGALSLMRDRLTTSFFVMNADLLTNINFEHMLRYHYSMGAEATMGVREFEFEVPYGVVNIKGQLIMDIEEKPTQSFFVNGGVYILEPSVLKLIPNDNFFDMPTLFEYILGRGQVAASFPIREYWLDIGRMSDFERANNEYREYF